MGGIRRMASKVLMRGIRYRLRPLAHGAGAGGLELADPDLGEIIHPDPAVARLDDLPLGHRGIQDELPAALLGRHASDEASRGDIRLSTSGCTDQLHPHLPPPPARPPGPPPSAPAPWCSTCGPSPSAPDIAALA